MIKTKTDIDDINMDFALFFYTEGISFHKIQNPHLRRALAKLNKKFRLINNQQLNGPFLYSTYMHLKNIESEFCSKSYGTLACHAWVNAQSDSVINYMMNIPGKQEVFLESVNINNVVNRDFIVDDISRVFNCSGYDYVGCAMDNSTTHKHAQIILRERFPNKYFYGCLTHSLHLLIKDIFDVNSNSESVPLCNNNSMAATTSSNRSSNYNTNNNMSSIITTTSYNPLIYLSEYIENCKDIVLFFNQNNFLNSKLENWSEYNFMQYNFIRCNLHGNVQWHTLLNYMNNLSQACNEMYTCVHKEDFITSYLLTMKERHTRENIVALISDSSFANNLRKVISILEPIHSMLSIFQDNSAPISDVFHYYNQLSVEMINNEFLSLDERQYILSLIRRRWDSLYVQEVHGLAYMLDPRYVGEKLSSENKISIRTLMGEINTSSLRSESTNLSNSVSTINTENHKLAVYQEYTQFKLYCNDIKEKNPMEYISLQKKNLTILDFWKDTGRDNWPNLYDIAIRIFSLSPSVCSNEKISQVMTYINTMDNTNDIQDNSIDMLTYIKCNADVFISSKSDTSMGEESISEIHDRNINNTNGIKIDDLRKDNLADEEGDNYSDTIDVADIDTVTV
jgi:hypothetical protein